MEALKEGFSRIEDDRPAIVGILAVPRRGETTALLTGRRGIPERAEETTPSFEGREGVDELAEPFLRRLCPIAVSMAK